MREKPFGRTSLKRFAYQVLLKKKNTYVSIPHILESDNQL